MADAKLSIVRTASWQALVRRLDAAVARDGRLVDARDTVLRPVELLRVMAADAYGSLGDDVLSADRLRAMLFLALPYVAVAHEARALLSVETGAAPSDPDPTLVTSGPTVRWPPPQPYDPGVIDHAALLVLVIAAARVADPPLVPVFIATVHGLALAASAAEVLGRLEPRQPDAEALEIILETLYVVETARALTKNQVLRPFVLDPVERGRWRCLEEMLAESQLVRSILDMNAGWDGATSHEILRVKPKMAFAGDAIVLTVVRSAPAPNAPPSDPLHDAQVVFASADAPPIAAAARLLPAQADQAVDVEVTVPSGAVTGWIGFSRKDMIEASNRRRDALRTLLAAQLEKPCVDGVGRISPERTLPHYGEIAIPRRRGRNRFESGEPMALFAAVTPDRVRPCGHATISWATAGADFVTIAEGGHAIVERGDPVGTFEFTAPPADRKIEIVVTPYAVRDGGPIPGEARTVALDVRSPPTIAAIDVQQEGRPGPFFEGRPLDVVVRLDEPRTVADGLLYVDDPTAAPILPSTSGEPGRVAFVMPPDSLRDDMVITVTVTDETGARDSKSQGPIRIGPIRLGQVVLVRPAVVDPPERRLDHEFATACVASAAAKLGLTLAVVELPWADDELAVLAERPSGDADPALLRVLEALAYRSLLTPGFEGALWLVLAPEPKNGRPLSCWAPGYAARALAVANPSGLPRLLSEVFKSDEPAAAEGPHLAIHGTIEADTAIVDELRVDERTAGPGAPLDTKFSVVTLDAEGRELSCRCARVLSSTRQARLDMLVPISGEVASIELRRSTSRDLRATGRSLVVLRRTRGALTLAVKPADPEAPHDRIQWGWKHTTNARPRARLVLRRSDLQTPVLDLDPCRCTVRLPLWRFQSADGLGIHATDGWNSADAPIEGGAFTNELTVVLRRLSDGRFWADVSPGSTFTWLLNGEERAENEPTLRLAPGDAGLLAIEARRGDVVLRDTREVLAGDAR